MTESEATHDPEETHQSFRWLSGWSRLVLDMLAITFGVLLAFALKEGWSSRVEAQRVDRAVAAIESEMATNLRTLGSSLDYRVEMYPRVRAVAAGRATFSEIGFRGVRPPRLGKAAFNVAISTGALADIDPQRARRIVATYLMSERVEGVQTIYASGLPSAILQFDSRDDPRIAAYMQQAFQDFIFAESETYNALADYLGEDTRPNAWDTLRDLNAGEWEPALATEDDAEAGSE